VWDGIISGEGVWNSGGSVYEMAKEYRDASKTTEGAVRRLIRWQSGKAAASGFAAGVPGFVAMPLTIPFDMAMNAYFQLRMICVIAVLYGWDAKSDRLRTLVMMLMLGSGASEPVRLTATTVGKSSFKSAVMAIPKQTIVNINRGLKPFLGTGRAVTKAGEKGLVNLTKFVPFVGGVAGGSVDWGATYLIGRSANRMLRGGPILTEEPGREACAAERNRKAA
jgi:uncharacterized protein (DUF697 family)